MKRKYVTPMIAVEHYELTQTIADCSRKIGFWDRECVLKDADSTNEMRNLAAKYYFSAGHCANSANGMSENDGICYHTNLNTAFGS